MHKLAGWAFPRPGAWYDIAAWRGSRFASRSNQNSDGRHRTHIIWREPVTSGASPLGLAIGGIATCSGAGGSLPQASPGMGTWMPGTSFNTGMSTAGTVGSTTIFDGGGHQEAPQALARDAGAPSAGFALLRREWGQSGLVPLGLTKLESEASVLHVALTPNPLAPLMTLTPWL